MRSLWLLRRKAKGVIVVVLSIALLVVAPLCLLSVLSRRPHELGVRDGRLAACPSSPNCVSTQAIDVRHAMEPIPLKGTPERALQHLKDLIRKMPRTKVITEKANYLHVEFRSLLFRFVDDVEFYIDPETQLIHFRSASRTGYSDLGVNRKRMEAIRKKLLARG